MHVFGSKSMAGLFSFWKSMTWEISTFIFELRGQRDVQHNSKVAHDLPGCFLSKIISNRNIIREPISKNFLWVTSKRRPDKPANVHGFYSQKGLLKNHYPSLFIFLLSTDISSLNISFSSPQWQRRHNLWKLVRQI